MVLVATMPIYDQKLYNFFLQNQKFNGLKVYEIYINKDAGLILTYFAVRSNLVINAYCASDQKSCGRSQDHWFLWYKVCRFSLM